MKRRDLKVVIMSATIDLDKFRNYFPKSAFKFGEIDAGSETTYPVSVKWIDRPKDWKLDAIDITMRILKKMNKKIFISLHLKHKIYIQLYKILIIK